MLPDRGEALVMLAAAALVLVVLLPTLGRLSLWYDEIITSDAAQLSLPALIVERLKRGHFPTYFAFVKLLGLAGTSEFWLRLPSALFSAGAASLLALVAIRFLGPIATVATAILYAALPIMIEYGQEARPYTAMLFFLSLALLAHLSMLAGRPGFARYGTLATIGAIGAALAIPAGIVAVALQHAALVACGIRSAPEAERRVWLRHLRITWIIIAIAAIGLLPNVIGQLRSEQGLKKWQVFVPFGQRLRETFRALYGFAFETDVNRYLPAGCEAGLAIAFLALLVIGIAFGFRQRIERYLIVIAVGTPLVFVVIGSVSALVPRYLISMMPATILLAGSAVGLLLARPAWRLPVGAILAAAMVPLWLQAFDTLASERKIDWRAVSAFLHDNGVRDIELLSTSTQIPRIFRHYQPRSDGFTYLAKGPPANPPDIIWQAARARDVAWLALFYTDALPADVAAGRVVCRWRFGHFSLFVAARDAAALPAPLRDCAAKP